MTFALSEATRLIGQLRREQLQTREFSVAIRFDDFTEVNGGHRFRAPQFQNSIINTAIEAVFRDFMADQGQTGAADPGIAFGNLSRLDTQPTLWGTTDAEKWGALDEAAHKLSGQLNKTALMTGAQLALQKLDQGPQKTPRPNARLCRSGRW